MNKDKIIDKLLNDFNKDQAAYVCATIEWETAHTWQPVREAFWKSEKWRKQHLRYWPYYGRGYVQLTWEYNYAKFSDILNIDLINNPDMALDPYVAYEILVYGFKHGSFTGRKISDYINKNQVNYYRARQCINGLDKARTIAKIAREYRVRI